MKDLKAPAITEKEKATAESVVYAESDKPVLGTPMYYPPNWRDERHIRTQLLVLMLQRPNASVASAIEAAAEAAKFCIHGDTPSKIHKVQ